jgi:SagB-type dehydrogenase family enzyme
MSIPSFSRKRFSISEEIWYNMQGGATMKDKTISCAKLLCWLAFAAGLVACAQLSTSEMPTTVTGLSTPLPPPALVGDTSLEELLALRRSVRQYDDQPLTTAELGQLLWAAQGITSEDGLRTAPSAGALYPLEIYLATAEGVFHYDPQNHQLLVVSQNDARTDLYAAARRQNPVRQAPAVFIVTAVYERTAEQFGDERTPRYVHLEAGHAAQNLLLQAVALDLGAVSIGGFTDKEVQEALGLPADHQPLYLIPVGHRQDAGS